MSSKKKKVKSLPKVLQEILKKLRKADYQEIFHYPVTGVPHYEEYITEPMDFSTMEGKIQSYPTVAAFKDDCDLIWDNCQHFNEENTIYHQEAGRLRKFANRLCKDQEKLMPAPERKVSRKRTSVSPPAPVRQTQVKDEKPTQPAALLPQTTPVKQKRKYIKSGLYRKSREVRTMMGEGVTNDFGMGSTSSLGDLVTIWDREQELQILTGKHSNERTEDSVDNVHLGPLWYNMYRPHTQYEFLSRYPTQLRLFHQDMPDVCKEKAEKKIKTFDESDYGVEMYTPPTEILEELKDLKPTFTEGAPFGMSKERLRQLSEFLKARPDLCCDENAPQEARYWNRITGWITTWKCSACSYENAIRKDVNTCHMCKASKPRPVASMPHY